MRVLFIVFLLFHGTLVHANPADSIDRVNRATLEYLKDQEVISASMRDFLISQVDSIIINTTDKYLISQAEGYIDELNTIGFIRYKSKPLAEISNRLLRRFDINEDRFSNIVYIRHKNARKIPYPNLYPDITIYDGHIELRLVTVYRGSKWVFFDQVDVLVDDERFKYYDKNVDRQAKSGGVEERSIISIDEYLLDMLNKIVLTEGVVEYRLSGDYYADRRIGRSELRVITDTFELANALIAD